VFARKLVLQTKKVKPMTPSKNAGGYTFAELYDAAANKQTKAKPMTYATDTQELEWANEDEADRKAADALRNKTPNKNAWPLDPSASPSTSDVEFYQRRGE
jgi:hypothetical protein